MRAVRTRAAATRLSGRQALLGGAVVVALVLVVVVPRLSSHSPAAAPAKANAAPTAKAAAVPRGPVLARLSGDPQPAPLRGQLGSFTTFSAKDPFAPQLGTTPAPAAAAATATPAAPAAAASAAAPAPSPAASRSPLAAGGTGAQAVLSVDGVTETVAVGASFPAADPAFTLVRLGSGGAEIGIAGGSYASGASTVTLTPGTPLTLVNTRDGKRYELSLLTAS